LKCYSQVINTPLYLGLNVGPEASYPELVFVVSISPSTQMLE